MLTDINTVALCYRASFGNTFFEAAITPWVTMTMIQFVSLIIDTADCDPISAYFLALNP